MISFGRSLVCRMAGVVLVLLLLAVSGCRRTPDEVTGRMDVADSIMEERPDSALTILESVDTTQLHGRADRARYALLKSMAIDKNLIDTATFSILQPAIDYYLKHGTPDQRLKTRYYEGRIHMNRGDDAAALTSFLQAAEDSAECTDPSALARLLIVQGYMYYREHQFRPYTECNLKAAEIYRSTGDSIQLQGCLARALIGSNILGDSLLATSILDSSIDIIERNRYPEEALKISVLSAFPNYRSKEDFDTFLGYLNRDSLSSGALATELGYTLFRYGDKSNALKYIDMGDMSDSIHYYAVKSDILENCNDYQGALEAYKSYLTAEENSIQEMVNNELLFTRRKYSLEMDSLNAISLRERYIYITCGVIIILVMLCILTVLYLRNVRLSLSSTRLSLENTRLNYDLSCSERDKLEAQNTLLSERLENERTSLEDLLLENKELSERLKFLISNRLNIINGILASEVSGNEKFGIPFKELSSKIHEDKNSFMAHVRETIEISYPKFMLYLREHNLTEFEVNYVCLYCLGLKGNDMGTYLGVANHYNFSHAIRKKLGIDKEKIFLGKYLVNLMQSL
ncbi:MAG: hypothetical protein K2I91_02745 [Muribaculaceae bacterium]|nr:hypothetical protein [Muribaculaceae bacterium]